MTGNIPSLEKQLLIDGYRQLNRTKKENLDRWDPRYLGEIEAGQLCTLRLQATPYLGRMTQFLFEEGKGHQEPITFLGQVRRSKVAERPQHGLHLSYLLSVHHPDAGPFEALFRMSILSYLPVKDRKRLHLSLVIETWPCGTGPLEHTDVGMALFDLPGSQ